MNIFDLVLSALLSAAVFSLIAVLARVPVPVAPKFGHRGVARRRALEQGGAFPMIEPVLRWLAGIVADMPLASLRARQRTELVRADHWLGLTPDEYTGLSLLSGLALGIVVAALAQAADVDLVVALPGTAFGLILPTLRVQEIVRQRAKEISRGLPHAIEIMSMCLSAGLDFPGALKLLSQPAMGPADALARECSLIFEELELGHTRREALLAFADRVPTAPVRDLVIAIVQAEQKGSPLARAIQIQGRMLSTRRSVAAEEAAVRAGVFMVAPLMLLVGCVLLLLLGPLVVKGIGF